ncbi:LptF/LptG family permease [Phaeocystidibacter luteus]|uniref:YjgP/YjgQ family permease n=1 Tax=Phaeocystidibacter luteus TaxID=911197 RepID=A0A6N6RD09_9FLAO|nr:LptF/LptG family permease [Phaeocystidibacter luteus]KAB2806765.1 YjgP/YjgQ family permease [Phaeocystidibacter luteus]
MKKIDLYILKKFLGTFTLFFVLLMLIAVVIDISEKLDDFTTNGATLEEIVFDYYANFIVFYGNLFSALILFLATIYFTSKLANNTEIVPILTGGRSFARFTLPYFVGAFFIFLLSSAVNHYLIPQTNIDRLNFEAKYTKVRDNRKTQELFRQVEPGHIVYFRSFSPDRHTGYDFSYDVYENNTLVSKLSVDYLRFDSIQNTWRLDNWRIREISPDGTERLRAGRRMDTTFVFGANDIVPELSVTQMMTTPKLIEFIEKEKIRGSELLSEHEIELHNRTAYPFSSFILVLIGVSISSRKRRGGLGINIAVGLVLVMIYIFFMEVSTALSVNGTVSPILAVWTPNIVFALLGLYTFRIAPK